ncbi:DUF5813 family protein [Halobacteria archaeon AArc-dxtr1]|nr:DUF5813 family protein [Halobacteria archaeon AArc-dxtr1]
MTDQLNPVERALDAHDAFERTDAGYDLRTTVFETTVAPANTGESALSVTVSLPSLSAATVDDVAPVVADDWFETLERRLADVFSVASPVAHDEPTLERQDDEVRVRLTYTASGPASGVSDAKALIEYVEGTYAQGVIPGYEYRGPAETLLANAKNRGNERAGDTGPQP